MQRTRGRTGALRLAASLLTAAIAVAQVPERYRPLPALVPSGWSTLGEACEVAVGDFDGDGNLDLFGRPGRLARGDGNGTFAAPVPFGLIGTPVSGVGAQQLAVADFDGDGRDDVVAVTNHLFGGDTIELYSSQVQGPVRVILPVLFTGFCGTTRTLVTTGDVDADGLPDLLVATTRCGQAPVTDFPVTPLLLRNLGNNTFGYINLPPVLVSANRIWMADVDIDGDLDVVILQDGNPAAQPQARVLVLRQDPAQQFVAVTAFGVGGTLAAAADETADLADLDGDNAPDLVVVAANGSDVLRNVGGVFARIGNGPVAAGAHPHLCLRDVDGDGQAEAVLLQHEARLEVWKHVPGGSMRLHAAYGIPLGDEAAAATAAPVFADLDADGDLDVVVPRPEGTLLWYGDATGAFLAAPTAPSSALGRSMFVDLDGDGFADQLGLLPNLTVGRNDGSGRMLPVPIALPDLRLQGTPIAAPIDFDGDGDTDLAIFDGAAGPQSTIVVRDDGGGAFSVPLRVSGRGNEVRAFTRDIDRDGDPDLVVVHRGLQESIEVAQNGGNGLWGRRVLAQLAGMHDAMPCNFDSDGAVDLLVLAAAAHVLRNDGAGNFAPVPNFPAVGSPSAAVGDLDGDGDDDFVIGGAVVRNLGAAGFSTTVVLQGADVWGISDVDRDGRPDLVLAQGASLLVYRQLANGTFALFEQQAGPGELPGRSPWSRALDIDRDGDLDLAVAGRFWFDTGHQLTRRNMPRLGRPSTKVVMAPPGTMVAAGTSSARVTSAAPPFGTLFLDLATLNIVGTSVTNARGEAEFTTIVPNTLSLLGSYIEWQAVTFDGPWYTGPEPSLIGPR